MYPRFFQGIFGLLVLGSASANVEKRTVADGTGDASKVGSHFAFGYNGLTGPLYWSKFNPLCGGNIQSPINIEPLAVDFRSTLKGVVPNELGLLPEINYPDTPGSIKNLGDTIKFTPTQATGTFYRGPNNTYSMQQFHFHTPSEHRLNGIDYPMEVHFVHYGPAGSSQLAVIGAFIRYGDFTSPFIKDIITAVTGLAVGASKDVTMKYTNVVNVLTASSEFYRYTGSLTTPPCTEGVQWLVASDPGLVVTYSDYKILSDMMKHSSRVTMPIADVYDAEWVTKRKSSYLPENWVEKPEEEKHFHFKYNYDGFTGPLYWGLFNENCNGKIQSPINIEPKSIDFAKTLSGVLDNPKGLYPAITYPPSAGTLKNLGDTLKFTPAVATGVFYRAANDVFSMAQFHLHTPSEHRIDGRDYPMEIHFVHTKGSELAVIGAFIDFAPTTSPFIAAIVANADIAVGASKDVTMDFSNAVNAIKSSTKLYRYTGSLTTPPCLEGVKWLVAGTPSFGITVTDFKILKAKMNHNSRVTMPIADMHDADWAIKRKSDYFPDGHVAAAPVAGGH